MKPIHITSAILILLLEITRGEARMVRTWSYAELLKSADVVVIAKAVLNTDTKDLFENRGGYIGINTEFEVEAFLREMLVQKS